MTTSVWNKFLLLSWKNWLIQFRHPIQTAIEILIPIFVCSFLLLIRALVEVRVEENEWRFARIRVDDFIPIMNANVSRTIFYSPQNDVLDEIVHQTAQKLIFSDHQGFPNAETLEGAALTLLPFASIEFDQGLANINDPSDLPDRINYAIRFPAELRGFGSIAAAAFSMNWMTNIRFGFEFLPGPRNGRENDGGQPPGYIRQGFVALQNALDQSIIEAIAGPTAEFPPLFINRFPFPEHVNDILGVILAFTIPTIILVAFLYSALNNIKYIAIEKELQLKETMKIMGLPGYLHWIAWFVKCMTFQLIIVSIIVVIMKIPVQDGLSVFNLTDWSVLWVFLFLYSMAGVTFSFMFSTFFSKANMAAIVGALVWLLMIQPYVIININYESISLPVKLATCLLVNSGMGFGFKTLGLYESAQIGVQWSNLFTPVTPDDDMTLGYVMIILLIASILQMIIALYVEKVKPGDFGVPEPWYFPFSPKFWCGGKASSSDVNNYPIKMNPNFESEPMDKRAGIKIRGLRKKYGKKVAVDNLHLNLYEDQITVLLGHNGAGKSTTMSMLTGLFPPTSGTAFINNYDIRSDINSIRGSLGLCPQHNVLFNELTVREHIVFFSKLKGVSNNKDIDEEIRKYVDLLGLQPKINAQSKTLSGGMKRKLSVGIALCGNSKVVMCDEPTSGMDPAARRALWDVLIQEKKGRTILLTTHFMDEADILGDRIAIMSDGELKTVGSSFFLKKRFGVGYRLICVKKPMCDVQRVTKFLAKFIPNVAIETNIGTELTYTLLESYVRNFRTIFENLENSLELLKISSFGLSLTTMEEVFLKVGRDSSSLDVEERYDNTSLNGSGNEKDSQMSFQKLIDMDLVYGGTLFLNQTIAMIMKKFYYTVRNYVMLIVQFMIPILFAVVTMLFADFLDGTDDLPELPISFDEYIRTVTILEDQHVGENEVFPSIISSYRHIFEKFPAQHELTSTFPNLGMEDTFLEKARESLANVNLNYMVGTTFNATDVTAWFNNQPFHTVPLTINLINNAFLKAFTGENKREITLSNKPLPFTLDTRLVQLTAGNNLGFNVALNTGFVMALVVALYVMFYIKERVSKAKLLQVISGVNKFIFWMVAFVLDYIIFFLIVVVYIAVLGAYQQDGFSTFDELLRMSSIILLFGFAALPLTYVLSFFFRVPTTGLVALAIGYIITGTIFYMVYFTLINEALDLEWIAEPLGWLFLIFPHYSMTRALSNLNIMQTTFATCDRQCDVVPGCNMTFACALELPCDLPIIPPEIDFFCSLQASCCNRNYFSFEQTGTAIMMVAMALVGVVSFIFLFILEFRLVQTMINRCRRNNIPVDMPESEEGVLDSDVYAEKNKIRMLTPYYISKNNLVIKDFSKFYGKIMAVNQICVGVDKGECFGLLGVNGAGKTSTFKMLTGDENITSGDAWVDGINIRTDPNKVHQRIGYCPQFDALLDELTGRELLKIFALLRGVPRNKVNEVAVQLAEDLNFIKHLDKTTKQYSGGNKRKLSTALTLLGDPSVIYLDEISSGVDVGARRQLWNMIIKVRNSGKSVVLTSHSMEECENLATRIAIMVNGEFKCLGSVQHLKNKFSKGFLLTIKAGWDEDVVRMAAKLGAAKDFILKTFTGAALKEEYMDIQTYHIPSNNIKWSQIFGTMEEAKNELGIYDYSLGQTSLEQIFLFFTKKQRISAQHK